jgi:hypothetical protein
LKIENLASDPKKVECAPDDALFSPPHPGSKLPQPRRQIIWRHSPSGNLQFAICNSQFELRRAIIPAIAAIKLPF